MTKDEGHDFGLQHSALGILSSFVIRPSSFSAWLYLIWFSWRRQARARTMVWIALGLLAFAVALVAILHAAGAWDMRSWRFPRRIGFTQQQWLALFRAVDARCYPLNPVRGGVADAVIAAGGAALADERVREQAEFLAFTRAVVFSNFISFLLPLWTLSFATEGLGGDRESRSLVWLLTRPLPRPWIYLAKFLALLPWSLGFTLGGFVLLCAAAGEQGWRAAALYWPAVLWGGLAFSALFHFMGAFFRWPAVVAIVYAFFLETILGNMPGYLKRVSVSFYTRCMIFAEAESYGVAPDNPAVYLPVDGTTAWLVLMGLTVSLVGLGMIVFSRMEYD